jgi:hypothetical protein
MVLTVGVDVCLASANAYAIGLCVTDGGCSSRDHWSHRRSSPGHPGSHTLQPFTW